jgi:hypothetical protein
VTPCNTYRVGLASLYAALRKPFRLERDAHIDEDSGEEVGAAAKRPFQEAERNRRFRG